MKCSFSNKKDENNKELIKIIFNYDNKFYELKQINNIDLIRLKGSSTKLFIDGLS
jgi:hypothetical protein